MKKPYVKNLDVKNADETITYLTNEEINRNGLMRKKHREICTTLNYVGDFIILASTIIGCVSIAASASLICIPIGIKSSAIGLKICVITEGIKKYKSIIKKKKNKHDKIVSLAKSKLNRMEVLLNKIIRSSIYIAKSNDVKFD